MVSYPWIWRTYILIIGKKSLYRCIYMVHTYVVQGSTELYIFGCYVYMIYLLFLSLRHVWLLETLWTTANQDFLSFTISQSLLKFTSIESVMSSNHLILCHPLFLLPSISPSFRVFPNDLALSIRWPKYWNFSFSPPNEYPGLISFRIDWFYLFAVQGIFKSLLQLHNSKASILQHSAFFMVQPLHLCMTNGKNIALDYTGLSWLSDVSRIAIAFLPRSKCLLISCLGLCQVLYIPGFPCL